jgi:hypothetical protein
MLDTTTIYNFTILAQFRSIPHDIEHVRFPLQFCVMNEKSLCSILFHLLVPGGKCDTVISNPDSSASF